MRASALGQGLIFIANLTHETQYGFVDSPMEMSPQNTFGFVTTHKSVSQNLMWAFTELAPLREAANFH